MKVVIDTNIIVSGLLSPYGKPADILRLLLSGEVIICYDARIISEYRDVLHRSRFGFNRYKIEIILDYIENFGEIVTALPLKKSLPDPDDNPFLEVAISGKVNFLVTGNKRHYVKECCENIQVVTPLEFIEAYSNKIT